MRTGHRHEVAAGLGGELAHPALGGQPVSFAADDQHGHPEAADLLLDPVREVDPDEVGHAGDPGALPLGTWFSSRPGDGEQASRRQR